MFLRDPHPVIVLPSHQHRPRGRVVFSCAHELGHFQLGHGTRVDEYVAGSDDAKLKSGEELMADVFASSLLMPRQAVLHRFQSHAWEPSGATPRQLFAVAGELGVGYLTLVRHICYGLELVDHGWLRDRERVRPKEIRVEAIGDEASDHLLFVDTHWPAVPVDLEVGDCLAIPRVVGVGNVRALVVIRESGDWCFVRATQAGRTSLTLGGAVRAVRIARAGYCGSQKYRFLEDTEEE
jgi:hypothetical protein